MPSKDDMHIKATLTASLIASTIVTASIAAKAQPHAPSSVVIPVLDFQELREAPVNRWEGLEQAISRELKVPVHIVIQKNNRVAWYALQHKPPVFMTSALAAARLSQATGSIPVAAIKRRVYGHLASGAVIVRRESKIRTAQNLVGKTILAVRRDIVHGYALQMEWVRGQGVDPKLLTVYGANTYLDIVRSILEGRADAGFVRAGFLEHLASFGAPHLDELAVLDEHRDGHGNATTTASVPDAIVSVRKDLDPTTIERLTAAIIRLRVPGVERSADPYGFDPAPDLGPTVALADAVGYELRDPALPYEHGANFPPPPRRQAVHTSQTPPTPMAARPPAAPAMPHTPPAPSPSHAPSPFPIGPTHPPRVPTIPGTSAQ